jgi:hypothetical protein
VELPLTFYRDRKVKCDETRPLCRKCIQGNRVCAGYPDRIELTNSGNSGLQTHGSLANEIAFSPSSPGNTALTRRLSKLGCDVLHDISIRGSSITALFWGCVLPQLAFSDCGLHTATAALGAAFHVTRGRATSESPHLILCYGKAVREVQRHFVMDEFDSPCISATCLLLAFTDLLVGREVQALLHLQGTLALLQRGHPPVITADTRPVSPSVTDPCDHTQAFDIRDGVDLAGVVLDIGTASYALDIKPRLPSVSARQLSASLGSSQPMERLELQVLMAIHSGYTHANQASNFKYKPLQYHPPFLLVETGRSTGYLMDLLKELEVYTSHSLWRIRRRALVLRMQCRSCLIYLSTVAQPNETAYDAFTEVFASIVIDAEVVVERDIREQTGNGFQFSADLGTVQPLYLTATKSRISVLRQRAITLLRQSGRDGPFEGYKLAVVAQRAFEIEHETAWNDETLSMVVVDDVPEHRRIHGCGLDTEASTKTGHSILVAFFSLCKNVEDLMRTMSETEHQDIRHWHIWSEELPVLF